ncbi:hypothetical protein ACFE04_000706 [Oxalis oulophora]
MAPIGRKDGGGGYLIKAETPQFFKIILPSAVEQGKFMIPPKYASDYGSDFGNSIHLRVPGGKTWKLGLTKHNGEIWLQTGFREFIDYYSIVVGYLLLFRYKEASFCFDVTIFDHTATEIEYFYTSSDHIMSDCEDDVSVKSQEPNFTRSEKRSKSPGLYCPRPAKTMRTTLSDNTNECFKCHQTSQQELQGDGEGTSTYTRSPESTNFQQTAKEMPKSPQVVDSTYYYPSFTKTIGDSHLRCGAYMGVSSDYARKYLDKYEGPVTLHTSDGRKWPMKFVNQSERPKGQSRFCKGWLDFAGDNQLKTNDVCEFELRKGKEISFKVVISRYNEKENADVIKPKNFGAKSQNFNTDSEDDESIEILEQNSRSWQGQTAKEKSPQVEGPTHDNPLFTATIGHSHLQSGGYLCVPSAFAQEYLHECDDPVVLHTSDGRKWSLRYTHQAKYSQGKSFLTGNNWGLFARDNKLKNGDICLFELDESNEISFKVVISRFNEEENYEKKVNVMKSTVAPPTHEEKATDAQRPGAFKLTKPFFLINMQPSYVGGKCGANLPFKFAEQHLNLKNDEITVTDLGGKKKWTLGYKFSMNSGKSVLYRGWKEFSRDNNLTLGDVCRFELIDGIENSFRVLISSSDKDENPENQRV